MYFIQLAKDSYDVNWWGSFKDSQGSSKVLFQLLNLEMLHM